MTQSWLARVAGTLTGVLGSVSPSAASSAATASARSLASAALAGCSRSAVSRSSMACARQGEGWGHVPPGTCISFTKSKAFIAILKACVRGTNEHGVTATTL